MKLVTILISIMLVQQSAFAASKGVSAVRATNESWRVHAKMARMGVPSLGPVLAPIEETAASVDLAKPIETADFSDVTVVADYKTIQENFEKLRDYRFIPDANDKTFLRRESWLYPDDGCFARAALMNLNMEAWGQERMTKIFVFGDLEVATTNSPSGSVGWWYHVVPIVTDGTDKYVIDPAVDPIKPLKLEDWLARMTDPNITMAVCNSDSYSPYSVCKNAKADDDDSALSDQMSYLSSEKYRLESMGRDWQKELGEFPPWLAAPAQTPTEAPSTETAPVAVR